jgi:hypothetical protein
VFSGGKTSVQVLSCSMVVRQVFIVTCTQLLTMREVRNNVEKKCCECIHLFFQDNITFGAWCLFESDLYSGKYSKW